MPERMHPYEALEQADDMPVMAIIDTGIKPTPHNMDDRRMQYRDYQVVAVAPVEITIPGRAYTSELAEIATSERFFATRIGVETSYDWSYDLPAQMYPSKALPYTALREVDILLSGQGESARVYAGGEIDDSTFDLPETFLGEAPLETKILIGADTIVNWLEVFANITEAPAQKNMAFRTVDYVMPRVDADLMRLVVSAYIAGVPANELPIAEEHRYRALLDTAYTIQAESVRHASNIDDYYATLASGDERAIADLNLYGPPYGAQFVTPAERVALGFWARAYQIANGEVIETAEQIWMAREHHNEQGAKLPLHETLEQLNQPLDMAWAQVFASEKSDQQLAVYRSVIEKAVNGIIPRKYFASGKMRDTYGDY